MDKSRKYIFVFKYQDTIREPGSQGIPRPRSCTQVNQWRRLHHLDRTLFGIWKRFWTQWWRLLWTALQLLGSQFVSRRCFSVTVAS